jgi:hypothetical protein
MRLTLTVTTTDRHTYDVHTSLGVIVDWERKFHRRAGDLAAGFFIEDLAYLAYASEKRAGDTSQDFDTWLARVETIEVKDTQESHPTDAAPTVGN